MLYCALVCSWWSYNTVSLCAHPPLVCPGHAAISECDPYLWEEYERIYVQTAWSDYIYHQAARQEVYARHPNSHESEFYCSYSVSSLSLSFLCSFSSLPLLVIQEFWAPDSPIQTTIIFLMEKIIASMGDELKVYLPPMVQPVLKLFMQDSSQQKLVTQKVSCDGSMREVGWAQRDTVL